MLSFGLDESHAMLRESIRGFVRDKVEPLALAAEANRHFPREVVPLLAEQGLVGLKYPVELGGQGADIVAECILIEELTRASAGISAGVFAHCHLGIAPILYYGHGALRERYAAPALRGDLLAGFALTEPGAGSDVKGIRTRAVREDDGYRLNGQKAFITNGTAADYLIVAAYTDRARGARGISIFVVPTDTPGVTSRSIDKLGNLSSDTAEVFLTDVEVPVENRIGPDEGGFTQLMRTLVEGRIIVSTRALALAELAYEHAVRYANEREAFGQPIGRFQAVGHTIARMAVDIDAARLLISRAAHLSRAGLECAAEASKAKYFATTVAQRITTEALHIHGGWGFTRDFPVERLYRDAPETVIGEGTADIQLRLIAHAIGLA